MIDMPSQEVVGHPASPLARSGQNGHGADRLSASTLGRQSTATTTLGGDSALSYKVAPSALSMAFGMFGRCVAGCVGLWLVQPDLYCSKSSIQSRKGLGMLC